jgi:hypothetical protein
MVTVKLLRPLDGKEAGATATYPEADALRLERRGAVEIVKGKAAPKAENKMERQPQNKAAGKSAGKVN